MKTRKLYYEDVYMKECDATVISVSDDSILFDRTIFFPTGGGQSCDLGTVDDLPVIDVEEKTGPGLDGNTDRLIWHKVDPGRDGHMPEKGAVMKMKILWDRRFDNMQRHCGEHILSGVLHREFGAVNKGFHMGENYMTVDMDCPEEITMEKALKAEAGTNRIIWENLPVKRRIFETRRQAEDLALRKPLAIDEEISIVSIGDENDPSDCVACCGTHPAFSGQVGLLKIYKVEKNKSMYRIYFEAGKRAMEDYDAKHALVSQIGDDLSAGMDDIPEKYKAYKDKNQSAHRELTLLRKAVTKREVQDISAEMSKLHGGIVIRRYDFFGARELQKLGSSLEKETTRWGGLLLLAALHEKVLLLFSGGEHDCRRLADELAPDFGGRGGGRPDHSRITFHSTQDMDAFIDHLAGSLE